MTYDKELLFFNKFIERNKLKTNIINGKELPENIDLGIRSALGLEKDYLKTFSCAKLKPNEITHITDIFSCNYIFIPLNENQDSTLVVGPYVTHLVSKDDIDKKAEKYSLPPSTLLQIKDYFSYVPYIPDDSSIMIAVNCLGEVIFGSLENFTVKNKSNDTINYINITPSVKSADENNSPLLSIQTIESAYAMENELMDTISQGLLHKAEMFFTNIKPSNMFETRIVDRLRNAKNFMIILNTLARKAVEKGGVHPIYIDSVSSEFAIKIEAAQCLDECDELFAYMIKKYCRLVQKHSQKGYSLLVQKVITCIDTDITADLTLKTQAKLLNVNPSYLSTLFKKETGVTLTDYVNRRRVDRAKQLLKSSNAQIQNISQSCGIYDVNYFTKIFKKYEGVTPKEFRNAL